MIKLPPLGQPLHRVEKQADEIITYAFELPLEKNEVVTNVIGGRSRKGIIIEVTVPAQEVQGAASFSDETKKIKYTTNLGNTRSFQFIVRTYK